MAFTLDASGLTPVYGDEEAVGSSSSDGRRVILILKTYVYFKIVWDRHNPIDVVRTMNTNSQTSDEDELINRSTPLMKRYGFSIGMIFVLTHLFKIASRWLRTHYIMRRTDAFPAACPAALAF